jgi:Na+-driven multidrug efflux pump
MIWRIVRIGVPNSIIGVERTFGRLMLMGIVSPFGTVAVASHSLAQRMEFVFYVPSMALVTASSVLVGQNLGAKLPQRAEKGAWLAGATATSLMLVTAVPVLIWTEYVIRVFNSEPELVRVAATFVRIETAAYVMMGMSTVLQQSIQGAGDTVPPMFVSIASIWVIQIPVAYILSNHTSLGVYGARWAIVAGTLLGLICYLVYFRMGRWKHKRV